MMRRVPIPVRADVPTKLAPGVVIAIAGANILVFAYAVAQGPDGAGLLVDRFGLVPRELLRAAAHPAAAAPWAWLTPLTSMFLHGSLLHLAGNLLYLAIFGARIEDLLGHARFAIFYMACGLAASAIHVASDPSSYLPTVGASGAISGLLGAYAVSYPTGRLRLVWPGVPVPAVVFLAVWIALQVGSGLAARAEGGGTAWWAHVGGFAAGVALARSMWLRRPVRSRLRI
jgi:membrane associated rhomboid family serine protease